MVRDLTVSTLHPPNVRTKGTPPFTRIPRWEKRFWIGFMMVGIFTIPTYITYNLPNYRGGLGPNQLMLALRAREEAKAAAAAEKAQAK